MVFSSLQVCNIVATTQLKSELDLAVLSQNYEFITNKPERKRRKCDEKQKNKFSGAVARFANPKSSCLLFPNGKIVCVGAKTMSDVKTTIDKVAKLVNAPLIISSEITVRNVVGTFSFGKELKLQNLYEKLRLHHKLSFEPELFPGIKIQVGPDNIIANVFRSGKVVVTGASSVAKLHKGFAKTTRLLYSVI